jgi:hypothetical protein
MPFCKNNPKKKYKGTEPSPKGLGFCAHSEKLGVKKKGKDENEWIIKSTKTGVKRWIKIFSQKSSKKKKIQCIKSKETYNKIKKIKTKDINLDGFNFKYNKKVLEYCNNLCREKIIYTADKSSFKFVKSNDYESCDDIFKYLKLNKNSKCEEIIKKLEESKYQKMIIKKITNYKKIPDSVFDYYSENMSDKITDSDIVNIIYDYIRMKYNEYSILNIDVDWFFKETYTTITEEGPRDYIFDNLEILSKKQLNKKSSWLSKLFN